ncbi:MULTISPECIES: magnesium transporter [Methylovorus]|jgi:magnesium transporter|uniref:Magnesium transporter MgtE n=1 Tax=Methylovorus glucosotrophus (strain SIP3-4) TaxID=582744 RepID=C6X8W0_METGS|nr:MULTISPECIES: magnesium transporter [Methylovorus]ACT49580.1 magnesium transporter [Methylovorus glucosotrophus SIP3-4]ADQ83531.1 magnesium transporter [Methylovorus sp. MP688]KAF0836196.1 magnesium transporter [Methylovorus glucosotrophus]MCB5205732.1 magnesium transporter [Methylovorus mays]
MADIQESKESLQESLQQVITLLSKHRLVEDLIHKQDMPKQQLVETLVHKQNLAELQKKLDALHPADVAYILEALPLEQRLDVWELVKAERDGEILLEVSDAVRQTLIADMDSDELLAAAEQLDTDELADLAPDLPKDVLQELLDSLDIRNRERLQSALGYEDDTVGALMDFDIVTIREDITLEVALRYLRRIGGLPDHTDKLFVVDRYDILRGVLPLKRMVVNDLDAEVADIMADDAVVFHPEDEADEAAKAFERYDLVTAPVVDANNKLVGRLTVDTVMDYIREEAESDMLSMAGLREEEDLFSSVWKSVQNRWTWLAINLVTAFVASRVIGMFEDSIEKIVALAALMPIVAGIGGNSGNQTTTMIVRGLALGQIASHNMKSLLKKELGVALLNGLLWGSVLGVVAYALYHNIALGLVMTGAMTLNLLLAAIMGVMIPLVMTKVGRDPAVGSSVLITAMTDSGGFFIFLGLATIFLL